MAAARGLSVVVTVASERRAAMYAAMGERAYTLRLSDPSDAADEIVARARDTPFAAIVGVDDQGVMAAALASERLGWLTTRPPRRPHARQGGDAPGSRGCERTAARLCAPRRER